MNATENTAAPGRTRLRPAARLLLAACATVGLAGCGMFGGRAPAAAVLPVEQPAASVAFSEMHFRCGDHELSLQSLGEGVSLRVAGRSWPMRAERAASGAKLVGVEDDSTVFWSKGDSAVLVLNGVQQPECTRVVGGRRVLRAVGHEPAWLLDVTERALHLLTEMGENRVLAPSPLVVEGQGFRHYVAQTAEGELSAMVSEHLCVDTMSGMTHPFSVQLNWQGSTLRGCGGEPASLLQGGVWQVTEIDGVAVADPGRVTLDFGTEGRIAGLAACNRYGGEYTLSGEGLRFSALFGTRMACAPQAMTEETRFHAAMAQVSGFALDTRSTLLLRAADRVVLKALRSQ